MNKFTLFAALAFLALLAAAPRLLAQQSTATRLDSPTTAPAAEGASGVKPEDLVRDRSDYHIAAGDLVRISIHDLMGEGTGETVKQAHVSETGTVNLPFVSAVKAEGATEAELVQAISKAYSDAKMIRNALVSVEVVEAHGRYFNVLGNVRDVGQFVLVNGNVRLLDALALAKGSTGDIQSVLVVRQDEARKIEISGPRLMSGDPDVNVFIHPHDTIIVTARAGPTTRN